MSAPDAELADTHCHLMLEAFHDDREAVLQRARQAGVTRILLPGIDLVTSEQAVELAQTHPELYAAVGVHPHSASQWDARVAAQLRHLARHPKVVAIGEIGLDYYRDLAPRPQQRHALEAQLALAADLGLPVVIHNRQAMQDLLAALIEWAQSLERAAPGRPPGVLHAYSGDQEAAQATAEAGFFFGLGGPLTFPNAHLRRTITKSLPLDRLVLETDAPYLAPQPHRGRRNEPAHVRLVAERLAQLLERPLPRLAKVTTDNASRLFGW
jgi:TatD DNase family protein